jgi:integrase
MRPATTDSPSADFPHSRDHIDCPACERLRLSILSPELFGRLAFRDAAPIWLHDHKDRIAPKTYAGYEFYLKALTRFFGALELGNIHVGHVRAYQQERSRGAGPSCVNHEINTLKQILGRAGLWSEIAKFYRPLKLGKAMVGCALDQIEEQRLFIAAASNPRWKVAYWCSLVTATTTAGPGEICHLHLDDINLGETPTFRIRDGLKNVHRDRIVTLNGTAVWAAGQILKRYYRLCRRLKIPPCGDHYILPGRGQRSGFDPWKPMLSWRSAWRALRREAGLPTLRMYDLRHHAITKLLEDAEISEQTVEEIAGHVSERMKKRYSHIRLQPKRSAVAKLEIGLPAGAPVETVEIVRNQSETDPKAAPLAKIRF